MVEVMVLTDIVGRVGAVTVMVIELEPTVVIEAQVIFDVNTQVIISPFTKVLLE